MKDELKNKEQVIKKLQNKGRITFSFDPRDHGIWGIPNEFKYILTPEQYKKALEVYNKLQDWWQIAYELDRELSRRYLDGVNRFERWLAKTITKNGLPCEVGDEGDDAIELYFPKEK